ncbi:hypothetical protein NP493_1059g00000 [Ridgeia piscesae]|uniref:Uncharacterized protein n=1 Tax=Ridgeia piscesae TaxID=27915 RepID=A0AAD9NIF8_RIDPI|nr:hypothetical protein NP493_1059g00000 [Ridgeia piscesae]
MTIRSLAEAMGITHVAGVDPSYYEMNTMQYNTSVNILPPAGVMLGAIRDIVSQENLTKVGIIYDDTFDLDNKPKRLLRNIPAQHLYMRMATTNDEIVKQLEKIKSAELHHLFLACSSANADVYLGKANEKGMSSFKFSWYILTKNSKVTCAKCHSRVSVLTLRGSTVYTPMNTYVDIMDRHFKSIHSSLSFSRSQIQMDAAFIFDLMMTIGQALDKLLTSGQWRQINYTDCFSFISTDPVALLQATTLKEEIKKVDRVGVFGQKNWTGDTAVPLITLVINRLQFKDGSMSSESRVGNWSVSQKMVTFFGSITKENLKKSYRVLTVEEPPFVFRTLTPPSSQIEYYYHNTTTGYYYYGYCIDLLYSINRTMKFDFTLLEPPDQKYGAMSPDGTWDGMINELIYDRADIIASTLSVMAERENVIDFTVPYYDLVGITILMKKPKFEYSVFKFMSVLEGAVWGCIFSAFIIVSILLAIFDRYSPYSYQNNKELWDGKGEEPRVFTLKEGLWFCMTSLTPQGGGEAPRALSGRLIAATWWVFGFIMIATYTANLAAFLTVSRLEQPIESLDDLAKQFKTKYAPQKSTSTETYFRRMADIEEKFYGIWKSMSLNDSLDQVERAKLAVWDYPVSDKFTNMWAAMEESGFPGSRVEAINRIKFPAKGEEFAFIGDATQNKYATLTDCDLWEVGEEFSRKPYAFGVQNGSPLKNELSSVILQLLNERALEDMKTKWWNYNRKDCPKVEDESDGISIKNIGGVFLVIFIGIGLGLVTLAFEYYWYKWRPSVRAKRNGGNGVVTNIGNSVVTVDTRVRNRGRNNSIQNGSLGHTNLAYN